MAGEYELARAFLSWLRRWRKPDAELDPDGATRTLRYTRAYRVLHWCLACLWACFLGLGVAVVIEDRKAFDALDVYPGGAFLSLLLLGSAYCIVDGYWQSVKLDGEGFTRYWFLRKPQRVEWAEIRSVESSGGGSGLKICTERYTILVPIYMNGLGRFALYLEHFAPVRIPRAVRELLPRLELAPDQTPSTPAG
jgi:hypothetical protein